MKRTMFLLLLISYGTRQNLYCQVDEKQKNGAFLTYYGFTGINVSSFLGDNSSHMSGLVGFEVGVGGPIVGFNEQCGLVGELMYVSRGSKYDFGPDYNGKLVTSYFNFPVFFKYKFTKTIYAEVGLQPGILLTAESTHGGNSYDHKDSISHFDLPALIGAGVTVTDKFGVELRYSPGLTNMMSFDYTNEKRFNCSISMNLIYFFGTREKKK